MDSVRVVAKEVKSDSSVVWESQVITEDGEDVIEEKLKKFEELVRVINKETNKVIFNMIYVSIGGMCWHNVSKKGTYASVILTML